MRGTGQGETRQEMMVIGFLEAKLCSFTLRARDKFCDQKKLNIYIIRGRKLTFEMKFNLITIFYGRHLEMRLRVRKVFRV